MTEDARMELAASMTTNQGEAFFCSQLPSLEPLRALYFQVLQRVWLAASPPVFCILGWRAAGLRGTIQGILALQGLPTYLRRAPVWSRKARQKALSPALL